MEVVLLYDNYVQVSLRGRRLKGKEKEKNNCLLAGVSLPPPSTRAPRVSLAPKTPFPFPFKRLPRRLCSSRCFNLLISQCFMWSRAGCYYRLAFHR